MCSVSELVRGFVRMQWKNVPEENRSINPIKDAPHNRRGALRYNFSSRFFDRDPPALSVFFKMHVIGQSKTGSSAPSIPKVASDPQGINS